MKSISGRSLNLNLGILSVFGWWPPDFCRNNWTIYLYHCYSILVVGFFYVLYMVTEFINIVKVWGDIEKIVEASFLLLTHIAQFLKLLTMIAWSENVKDLLDKFEDPQFNQITPAHIKIQKRSAFIVMRDTRVFLTLAASTVFLWALFPALEKNNEWQLPLKAWYPFNTQSAPVFYIIYWYQIIAVLIDAFTNICTDTLASGVMVLTGGQLDILNHNLATLKKSSDTEKSCKELSNQLKVNVRHHQDIIRIVADQASIFQTIYVGQFLVGVIVICITAFQLTLVPISIQFISMLLYMSCMLMEIFLYCYHGNEIIVKSTDIIKSAIECDWYNQDKEFKQILIFLMERAKYPLKVTAGKLFTLSLVTFMAILRSSYSYFAILQHMHNK